MPVFNILLSKNVCAFGYNDTAEYLHFMHEPSAHLHKRILPSFVFIFLFFLLFVFGSNWQWASAEPGTAATQGYELKPGETATVDGKKASETVKGDPSKCMSATNPKGKKCPCPVINVPVMSGVVVKCEAERTQYCESQAPSCDEFKANLKADGVSQADIPKNTGDPYSSPLPGGASLSPYNNGMGTYDLGQAAQNMSSNGTGIDWSNVTPAYTVPDSTQPYSGGWFETTPSFSEFVANQAQNYPETYNPYTLTPEAGGTQNNLSSPFDYSLQYSSTGSFVPSESTMYGQDWSNPQITDKMFLDAKAQAMQVPVLVFDGDGKLIAVHEGRDYGLKEPLYVQGRNLANYSLEHPYIFPAFDPENMASLNEKISDALSKADPRLNSVDYTGQKLADAVAGSLEKDVRDNWRNLSGSPQVWSTTNPNGSWNVENVNSYLQKPTEIAIPIDTTQFSSELPLDQNNSSANGGSGGGGSSAYDVDAPSISAPKDEGTIPTEVSRSSESPITRSQDTPPLATPPQIPTQQEPSGGQKGGSQGSGQQGGPSGGSQGQSGGGQSYSSSGGNWGGEQSSGWTSPSFNSSGGAPGAGYTSGSQVVQNKGAGSSAPPPQWPYVQPPKPSIAEILQSSQPPKSQTPKPTVAKSEQAETCSQYIKPPCPSGQLVCNTATRAWTCVAKENPVSEQSTVAQTSGKTQEIEEKTIGQRLADLTKPFTEPLKNFISPPLPQPQTRPIDAPKEGEGKDTQPPTQIADAGQPNVRPKLPYETVKETPLKSEADKTQTPPQQVTSNGISGQSAIPNVPGNTQGKGNAQSATRGLTPPSEPPKGQATADQNQPKAESAQKAESSDKAPVPERKSLWRSFVDALPSFGGNGDKSSQIAQSKAETQAESPLAGGTYKKDYVDSVFQAAFNELESKEKEKKSSWSNWFISSAVATERLDREAARQVLKEVQQNLSKYRLGGNAQYFGAFMGILAQETTGLDVGDASPKHAYNIGQNTNASIQDLFEKATPSFIRDPLLQKYGSAGNLMGRIEKGDWRASLDAGVAAFAQMKYRYGLSLPGMIAGYNGGNTRGAAYEREEKVPNETRNYVPLVMSHARYLMSGQTPPKQKDYESWQAIAEELRKDPSLASIPLDPSVGGATQTAESRAPTPQQKGGPTKPTRAAGPGRVKGIVVEGGEVKTSASVPADTSKDSKPQESMDKGKNATPEPPKPPVSPDALAKAGSALDKMSAQGNSLLPKVEGEIDTYFGPKGNISTLRSQMEKLGGQIYQYQGATRNAISELRKAAGTASDGDTKKAFESKADAIEKALVNAEKAADRNKLENLYDPLGSNRAFYDALKDIKAKNSALEKAGADAQKYTQDQRAALASSQPKPAEPGTGAGTGGGEGKGEGKGKGDDKGPGFRASDPQTGMTYTCTLSSDKACMEAVTKEVAMERLAQHLQRSGKSLPEGTQVKDYKAKKHDTGEGTRSASTPQPSAQPRLEGTIPARTNPMIVENMREASRYLPPGYTARVTPHGGYRANPDRPGSWHHKTDAKGNSLAVDVQIYDAQGKPIPNIRSPKNFQLYREFMQNVKAIQDQRYPELRGRGRWGGYFSDLANDMMHYDLNASNVTAAGNWSQGLSSKYSYYGARGQVGQGMGRMSEYSPLVQSETGSGVPAGPKSTYDIYDGDTKVASEISFPDGTIEKDGTVSLAADKNGRPLDTNGVPLGDKGTPLMVASGDAAPKGKIDPATGEYKFNDDRPAPEPRVPNNPWDGGRSDGYPYGSSRDIYGGQWPESQSSGSSFPGSSSGGQSSGGGTGSGGSKPVSMPPYTPAKPTPITGGGKPQPPIMTLTAPELSCAPSEVAPGGTVLITWKCATGAASSTGFVTKGISAGTTTVSIAKSTTAPSTYFLVSCVNPDTTQGPTSRCEVKIKPKAQ